MGIPDLRNKYKRPLYRPYLNRSLTYMKSKRILKETNKLNKNNLKIEISPVNNTPIKTENKKVFNKFLIKVLVQ